LRPYQTRGLAWLDFLRSVGLGGVLADDMGLGKTVQLLALLARHAGSEPSLLICPTSLVGNWQREAARFTPHLRVHVHHGKERVRGTRFAEAVASSDLVITTPHTPSPPATWPNCGTPVENRLADLWSILELANPGLLGSAETFRRRYAEPIERYGDDDAAQRLRRFTGPLVLRRVKTDKSIIADLPEKFEMDLLCNLTAEQAALYPAVEDQATDRVFRIGQKRTVQVRRFVCAGTIEERSRCPSRPCPVPSCWRGRCRPSWSRSLPTPGRRCSRATSTISTSSAAAPTGRSRASTSPPRSTCLRRRSTLTRSSVLRWRGRDREQLLGRLRELRGSAVVAQPGVSGPAPIAFGTELALAGLTDMDDLDRFWLPPPPLPARPPTLKVEPDLLLRQLPTPGTVLGGDALVERLRPVYRRFATAAE
jgi:hypothetical protein